MPYLVTCTFDLKNASSEDYQNAYADLSKLGLHKVVVAGDGRQVVTPTTTTVGTFNGASAMQVAQDVNNWVKAAFAARRFRSEIFVVAAGDGHWFAGTT
jgi:hypothetical protein